jgi:uncharacterized surface protein with fasciclin (FAS1) repeats
MFFRAKLCRLDLSDGMKAKTLNGKVTIHLKEGKVFINDAEVLADVKRIMELYIHAVNKVIMPAK